MRRSFKYRAYPTEAQRALIDNVLETNRILYNCALEERIASYKINKKSISYNAQAAALPEIQMLL